MNRRNREIILDGLVYTAGLAFVIQMLWMACS